MKELTEIEWQLLRNGSLNLYKNKTFFEEDCKSLENSGYKVAYINCDSVLSFTTDIIRSHNFVGIHT
ncbi:MAG: hypothetical protein QM493_04820 [Sulfurovum sp.]